MRYHGQSKAAQWLSCCSLAALAISGLAATASAQSRNDSGAFVLEEIVVTAQKREQSLQDVPSSVAAIGGEKLDILNAAGSDIRFLSGRIPSLTIESSFGRTFPRFYIRGLGNTDFDLNASQPVSLIYDEIVMENPILKGMPAFDLERVEVLRGPQGTLFGRNTPAGIVKLESKKPTHEFDAYGKFTYGRFDTIEFEGAVGGSLIKDVLAIRTSVKHQHRDDFITNDAPGLLANRDEIGGYDDFAGRVQLLYTPTDRFSALLNFHARSLDGTARVFQANIINPGVGGLVDDFDRRRVTQDGQNEQDLDQRGLTAKLEYKLDKFTITSITGFEHGEVFSVGDVDGGFGGEFEGVPSTPGFIPFNAETADAVPGLDQWTQELRLSSNDLGMIDFQVGFFYFDEDLKIESTNFNSLANNAPNGFASQRQKSESWAIFANVNIEVTPDLIVEGGVRYTEDDKDFTATRTLSPLSFLGIGGIGPLEANPSDEVLSWDVSATYMINDDISVYTRAAKGFRAPSIQGRLLFGDEVTVADTEEIFSVEAGIKTELFNNRMRLNLSAYVADMDGQQLTAVGGDANFNRLVNAADTNLSGVEMDLEWAVTNNLFVTAGASYNFTRINDPDLRTLPCGGGCTITDPIIDGFVQLDNNRLPQAPRWIANATARYGVPVGSVGEIYAYTDWAFTSEKNFFLFESPEFTSGRELIGGLRVGYNHDDRLDFALFGRNITDETELKGGIDFNNLTGFVNEPPIWGIEISARF
ncbi:MULTISPECIES: TonB-dependent receptor [unclassified Iodidimonas]|jgi:iron complex outermembrane receptor protein|uniref:TonB-dependent receptor n=1 Tax=unclassified Iodidimonas TaxID=2626145 RepID=UPI0024826309|nr:MULTISPECIES: TonB-dependent receptor [unclassified Iodidimonas]